MYKTLNLSTKILQKTPLTAKDTTNPSDLLRQLTQLISIKSTKAIKVITLCLPISKFLQGNTPMHANRMTECTNITRETE